MPLARVYHHAAAFVDADVRDERPARVRRKEHEVPAPQPASRVANFGLTDGAPGEFDAKFAEHILGEPGAIERVGSFRAPDIRPADKAGRQIDNVRRRRRQSIGQERERQQDRTCDSREHRRPVRLERQALLRIRGGGRGKLSANTINIVCGDDCRCRAELSEWNRSRAETRRVRTTGDCRDLATVFATGTSATVFQTSPKAESVIFEASFPGALGDV
jgi:hypothetical protein